MARLWLALAALALIGFALWRGGAFGRGSAPLDAIDPASEAALERALEGEAPASGAAPGPESAR